MNNDEELGKKFREVTVIGNALENAEREKKMTEKVSRLFLGIIIFILFVAGILYMAGAF